MNKPTGTPDAPRAVDAGMEAAAMEYCREEGYFSDSLNTWAMSASDAASFAAERTAALEAENAALKREKADAEHRFDQLASHHNERCTCMVIF
jgi:hypothetical protein